LLFFLGYDIKSSSLSFNHEPVLFHHDVVVLLFASLNSLNIWRRAGAALSDQFFNLVGIEPHFRLLEESKIGDDHGC